MYTLCLACTQIQAPRTKAGVSMYPVVGTDSLGSTTLSSPYQLGGCGNPPKTQVPNRSQGKPQDSGLRPAGLALLAHLLPIFVQFCPPSCPLSVLQREDMRSDSPGTAGWCSEVACVSPAGASGLVSPVLTLLSSSTGLSQSLEHHAVLLPPVLSQASSPPVPSSVVSCDICCVPAVLTIPQSTPCGSSKACVIWRCRPDTGQYVAHSRCTVAV